MESLGTLFYKATNDLDLIFKSVKNSDLYPIFKAQDHKSKQSTAAPVLLLVKGYDYILQ